MLVGQAFAQQTDKGSGTVASPLEALSTFEVLKWYTRESNVLLKFFKVLHHNFALHVYTGYTEVGHSPPYNIMNSCYYEPYTNIE